MARVMCVLRLITARESGHELLDRAANIIIALANDDGHACIIERLVSHIEGMDTAFSKALLAAVRESGYPGRAQALLTPPLLSITLTTTDSENEVKSTVPARVLRPASPARDPLADALKSLWVRFEIVVKNSEACVCFDAPEEKPLSNSIWRWTPIGWVEPKVHGPGATTCYCRKMARKMLAQEMRDGRASAEIRPELLPNVSNEDVGEVTKRIESVMYLGDSEEAQRTLTQDYGRLEQLAYFTGLRIANHSAALKIISAFPRDTRAVELARFLDPYADF